MTGSRLTIPAPADYDLPRDVCSYGYFLLAPNHWDVETQSLFRVLDLEDGATTVRITQPDTMQQRPERKRVPGTRTTNHQKKPPRGTHLKTLRAAFDRKLSRAEQQQARAQIARMLRLDESAENLRDFHKLDPRFKKSGRGRLFRSPSLFEDVVKTVTSCNVTWPSTVHMNTRLCEVLGRKSPTGGRAFPTPDRLARTRPGTLRARCRVGYRDQRMIDLARLFRKGDIDEPWLTDPETPDDDVFAFLKTLPGIGPYAAGNIMQLLGRYSRLALDTESIRHGRALLGYTGSERQILKQLAAHYEPFGAHKFRSYWFELWDFYESKAGPSHLWQRESTAKVFTAALLKK